jgi:hypothetical protein
MEMCSPQVQPHSGTRAAKIAVYCSYSVATWGWRTWEFAVVLILLRFDPNSLRLVAIYGILESLVAVVCGSAIGAYIDRYVSPFSPASAAPQPVNERLTTMPAAAHRHDRLMGACTMYIILNSCVAASATASGIYVLNDKALTSQVRQAHAVPLAVIDTHSAVSASIS